MNVLSLFTGAGGGELAFQHLLTGFRTVGYVEFESYCQKVLLQRIKDGFLDAAPIFGDIRAFISEGYAEAYRGMVDVVTAGFPCQPFSVAGKQLAEKDNRNLWPETIETIRIVKPTTVFLENVPGLLASEYAITIFGQLHENGYEMLPPLKLGADDIGANHRRKRIWIVADSGNGGASERARKGRTESPGRNEENGQAATNGLPAPPESSSLANSNIGRSQPGSDASRRKAGPVSGGRSERTGVANATNKRLERRDGLLKSEPGAPSATTAPNNWTTEPAMGRVAHGVAHRVDRLKAIGNGQVPAVAELAWKVLTNREGVNNNG